MGKHIKKLRAEKSKIKLKQKKLPKGTNITDASFTVKKIITLEQLKKPSENEPVTSWNQTLPTLFSHINHYNDKSRLNAVKGLKEILTTSPDSLRGPSLKKVVDNTLQLVCDIEQKVRKAAIDFLHMLFIIFDCGEIVPFYEKLYLHLCCGMKHKDVAIQKDSLQLLDIVMEYAPEIVQQNFKLKNFDLLNNLVRIMNTYKYGSLAEKFLRKGSDSEIELATISNLKRLYDLLSFEYKIEENKFVNQREMKSTERITDYLESCHNSFLKENLTLTVLKKKNDVQNKGIDREVSDFESHAALILPLLFQTWIEFSPNRTKDGFYLKSNLSENKRQILKYISFITNLLCDKAKDFKNEDMESRFNEKYKQTFSVIKKTSDLVKEKQKRPNIYPTMAS